MSTVITRNDFFKLFESIVPGGFTADSKESSINTGIYFEPLSMSGLDEMHKYSVDERLYEFLEFQPFRSIDETRAYLKKLIDRTSEIGEKKTAMYWFVRRRSDNQLVGTAGLVNLNYERQSIEWGYGVDPELWGFGYILQIQELLKHFVFSVLGLNRLDGVTMVTNERTISSLLAGGMVKEGILREYYCKGGVKIDGWKYSMLKDEYELIEKSHLKFNSNKCSKRDVINILNEVLCEEVDEHTTMYNSATWDSISHMNIMIKLYEEYKIELSPIQISNATSVESLYILINNLPKFNE